MRIKRNYIWPGGGWYGSGGETRYLYDGMLIVQERDGSNMPTVTYTRGRDLSGSLDGAGGIGGLLARSHGYSSGSWAYHNFYHADGNVTALADSGGTLQASYIYDPYGRYLTGTGTLLTANVMRFSSKPWVSFLGTSATSGLYYYGYRFYDPYLQRWLNRDPISEEAGVNLYCIAENDAVGEIDPHGLYGKKVHGIYSDEDCGWRASWWPWSYWRHFRKRLDEVDAELEKAVRDCNFQRFKSRMHQGQDWFAHHPYANRPWPIGHAPETICGRCPDKHPDQTALDDMKRWTEKWEEKWKQNCGELPKLKRPLRR